MTNLYAYDKKLYLIKGRLSSERERERGSWEYNKNDRERRYREVFLVRTKAAERDERNRFIYLLFEANEKKKKQSIRWIACIGLHDRQGISLYVVSVFVNTRPFVITLIVALISFKSNNYSFPVKDPPPSIESFVIKCILHDYSFVHA